MRSVKLVGLLLFHLLQAQPRPSVSIRLHKSESVSIRLHTAESVSIHLLLFQLLQHSRAQASAYVSIDQHTSA